MGFKTIHRDFISYNRNIQLAMFSAFFIAVGRGITLGSVFSVFAKILGGSNAALGLISTVGGLVMTVTLLPTGFLSDRMPRRHFLRIGSIFSIFGFIALIVAHDIWWLFLGQGILGLSRGMTQPTLESMIADSVESKKRDAIYSQIYFLRQASSAAGPALAVLLFLILGDNWGLETLRQVMIFGAIFTLIGVMFQVMMHDRDSLGLESESINTLANLNGDLDTKINNISTVDKWWFVPSSLIFLGFIIGFGAGMTVRFFAIFFKEIYNLPPSIVNGIFAFLFMFTGIMGLLTPRIAKYIGKIETIFIVQMIAIVCLVGIAFIPPLVILVPIFLMRGSFMNSSQPLQRSILMDRVPKKARGRWNALQVLSFGFLWSLSAGIGGFLLDIYDFPVLYLFTAFLYILGTFPLILLRNYVKEKPILQHSEIFPQIDETESKLAKLN
ncbi:MAG: MFS transporter [Candidatus Hodarchaeales archaeon]|jgi:MFS family permease